MIKPKKKSPTRVHLTKEGQNIAWGTIGQPAIDEEGNTIFDITLEEYALPIFRPLIFIPFRPKDAPSNIRHPRIEKGKELLVDVSQDGTKRKEAMKFTLKGGEINLGTLTRLKKERKNN